MKTARVNATYPMYGDITPKDWCDEVLGNAKKNGQIKSWSFIDSTPSVMGLEYVRFEVDMPAPEATDEDDIYELIRAFLNDIVHDEDVAVNHFMIISKED